MGCEMWGIFEGRDKAGADQPERSDECLIALSPKTVRARCIFAGGLIRSAAVALIVSGLVVEPPASHPPYCHSVRITEPHRTKHRDTPAMTITRIRGDGQGSK